MTVTISDATSGATIRYTTDGSTPTTSSPVYTGPIAVSQTTTIRAMARGERDDQQRRGHARPTRSSAAAGGDADVQPGRRDVHRVGDGDDQRRDAAARRSTTRPTAARRPRRRRSTPDRSPLIADHDDTGDGCGERDDQQRVASATYTIQQPQQVATPTFSPAAGTYTGSVTVTISVATSGATIHYTTDGSTPTTSSPIYTGPIALIADHDDRAMATASGMTNSNVASATYTIQQRTWRRRRSARPAGTYTGIGDGHDQRRDERRDDPLHDRRQHADRRRRRSTPGRSRSRRPRRSGPWQRRAGWPTATWPAPPTRSSSRWRRRPSARPAGTYTGSVTVTISDATSGATIHYTTDGSTPTTSSPVYTGPITAHADHDDPGDGGGERDGQQQRGQRHVHDPAAGGDAGVQPGRRDVYRIGDGDDQRRDERRDDPLHDRRQHADHFVAGLHRADHRSRRPRRSGRWPRRAGWPTATWPAPTTRSSSRWRRRRSARPPGRIPGP